MYVSPNYPTKKSLKQAVKEGKAISIFQPGPFGGSEPQNGKVSVEGPHSPKPHTWYAWVELKDGLIVKVN